MDKDGYLSSSTCVSAGKLEERVEDTDGNIDVTGDLAEDIGVAELKSEVVGGGHEVTNPSTGSEDTIPSVVHGFTESHWEDGSVGLLEEGESEEGDVVGLEGELDVTIHRALQVSWISDHIVFFGLKIIII